MPRTPATATVRKYNRRPSLKRVALILLTHSPEDLSVERKPSGERSRMAANWLILSNWPYCLIRVSSAVIVIVFQILSVPLLSPSKCTCPSKSDSIFLYYCTVHFNRRTFFSFSWPMQTQFRFPPSFFIFTVHSCRIADIRSFRFTKSRLWREEVSSLSAACLAVLRHPPQRGRSFPATPLPDWLKSNSNSNNKSKSS
jgi:hypothetical protein